MKKLFLLLLMVAAMATAAIAQNRTVNGVVTYEGDGEPLAGVTIMPIGGGHGTSTDIDGKFTLSVPASVKKIRVTYVGMLAQEVAVGKDLKIVMVSSDQKLDEVMVVAYGTAKKSAYTGSASVVDSKKIGDAMVTNAANALKGSVPGVTITSANGQPGTSPSIRIRGIGSINASTSPLYVLDGMPFDGDLASINTIDIESMTVLKDAAAAALYGARGANGVILITTKKGKEGSARITVDARWGVNSRQVPNYAVITEPGQYYELAYAAIKNGNVAAYGEAGAHNLANLYLNNPTIEHNAFGVGYKVFTVPTGQDIIGKNGKLNPNATLGWSDGRNYFTPDNWVDHSYERGLRQEYNLSIQGGNDRLNYYVNGGFLGDEGIVTGSDYQRISTRTAIDYQAKPWLKIGTNMAYNHVSTGYPDDQTTTNSGGNVFLMANTIAPIYPMFIRHADGTIMTDATTGYPVYDYGDGIYSRGVRSFYNKSNAVSDLIYSKREYFMDIFNGKWYATVTPVTNLDITANLGYFLDNTRYHNRTSKLYGQMAQYGGMNEQKHSRNSGVNFQLLGTYRHTIAEKHNLDYLVGYESYEKHWESLSGRGYNLYNPWNWTLNNTINDERRKSYGSAGAYSTRGILGRINYDYDTKYYASVSYRRDASSRFAPSKRWGNFFSLSAAWDVAKEAFAQDWSSWLDMFKVKASFGQQGNDGILDAEGYQQYYPYLDQYEISGVTEWSDGTLVYKGNPDVTWETSNTWNVGIDFGFKQGMVSGTIEYFNRTVTDMLYNKPVPPSNGYSYIPMNVGSIRNQGLEFDLNYRPVNTRDLTVEFNVNGTYLNAKVLTLSPDLNGELIDGSRLFREGEALYQLYLPSYAGVNNSGYLQDRNGDPILNEDGNRIAVTPGEPMWWANFNDYTQPIGWVEAKEGETADADGYLLDDNGNRIPNKWVQVEGATDQYDTARNNNRKATGSLLPKFYGGFGTTVRYRGFDFTAQFSFQVGGKIYDSGYTAMLHRGSTGDLGRNWHADIVNAWTPENPNTDIPSLNSASKYGLGSMSDFGLVSSDYLSLNNITVGYTLPDNLVSRIGLESVRVYCAGENLALWTKRRGLDPRNSFAGALNSNLYYSAIRNISGGIRVVF